MGGKIDVSKNDGRTPPMFIMNGENYHNIGSLLPLPCRQPKFAQLYIHDTDNEILNSLSIFGDFDSTTTERDLIVETTSGLLKCLLVISKFYLPFQYPLIFSRGEPEYTYDYMMILIQPQTKGKSNIKRENNPSTTGKRIVVPSIFIGETPYMFQNYQNVMAICSWVGYLNLFITFTCNLKWQELCKAIDKDALKSKDRLDLICKVFGIKFDQLISEIK
ncbi:hypothetical protein D0Y65_041874 [Glycine soja]|uniref:Helitron helicase-like domain-containing protein n=1 Tax=Glycine soja TaxID=3848 RepID=A0A445GXK3_GLYSO|nr:hypothetical protein D0Y65_041874 [Glycine soja]